MPPRRALRPQQAPPKHATAATAARRAPRAPCPPTAELQRRRRCHAHRAQSPPRDQTRCQSLARARPRTSTHARCSATPPLSAPRPQTRAALPTAARRRRRRCRTKTATAPQTARGRSMRSLALRCCGARKTPLRRAAWPPPPALPRTSWRSSASRPARQTRAAHCGSSPRRPNWPPRAWERAAHSAQPGASGSGASRPAPGCRLCAQPARPQQAPPPHWLTRPRQPRLRLRWRPAASPARPAAWPARAAQPLPRLTLRPSPQTLTTRGVARRGAHTPTARGGDAARRTRPTPQPTCSGTEGPASLASGTARRALACVGCCCGV